MARTSTPSPSVEYSAESNTGSFSKGERRAVPASRPKAVWSLLRKTGESWSEDKVPRLGAALAYYSALSIAPLLLIAVGLAGLIFGHEAARGHLMDQIRGMVGTEGGKAIEEMLVSARKPKEGILATTLGIATLLFAASGVFGQLQDAMNTIWEVEPKPGRGLLGFVKDRFFSFAMVFGTGFLLVVSLLLSAAVSAAVGAFGRLSPTLAPVAEVGDTVVSGLVVWLLFAMIFKILPDAEIAWRDAWIGAGVTTVLFLIGKAAIGLCLGRSGYGSAYGELGSLVVLLVWIYYSAQILFLGAEFTKVYATHYGSRIQPAPDAEPVTPEARAEQGIPKDRPNA